jgi:hypothetical protein
VRPARVLHKEILPRLKYHNPGLAIAVEQGPGRLRLTFESEDQRDLTELETAALETSTDGEYRTEWTPVVPKSQPQADAASSASNKATSTYTRTVDLVLGPHQPQNLWEWFRTTTNCSAVLPTSEETERKVELDEFFAKAELDRQRVKAGMDEIRKQREELKRAREAAARMAEE